MVLPCSFILILKLHPPTSGRRPTSLHTLHCFIRIRSFIRFAPLLIRSSAFGSAQPTARKANTLRPAHLRQPGTKCAQANAAPTHRGRDSHANQQQHISSSRRYIGPLYGAAARGHASVRRSRLKSNCVPLMASRQRLRATPLPKGSTVMPLAVAAPSFGRGYLCPAGSP